MLTAAHTTYTSKTICCIASSIANDTGIILAANMLGWPLIPDVLPLHQICENFLQAAKVPLNEYEFPTSKLANVQSQLEKLVEKNYYLHQSAKDAYRSYLLSYNSHQLKAIFNVHALDLAAVGKSFGFTRPPRVRTTSKFGIALAMSIVRDVAACNFGCYVDLQCKGAAKSRTSCYALLQDVYTMIAVQVTLNLESKASHTRKQNGQSCGDYKRQKPGHAFSSSNPYGKKHSGDQRQFARI